MKGFAHQLSKAGSAVVDKQGAGMLAPLELPQRPLLPEVRGDRPGCEAVRCQLDGRFQHLCQWQCAKGLLQIAPGRAGPGNRDGEGVEGGEFRARPCGQTPRFHELDAQFFRSASRAVVSVNFLFRGVVVEEKGVPAQSGGARFHNCQRSCHGHGGVRRGPSLEEHREPGAHCHGLVGRHHATSGEHRGASGVEGKWGNLVHGGPRYGKWFE